MHTICRLELYFYLLPNWTHLIPLCVLCLWYLCPPPAALDCRYYIHIYRHTHTFSMILLPPNRVTNSAGEATVKSLCRSMRRRSLPCFTKCSPDMLGLFWEIQRMHVKAPRNANSTFGMYSTLKQALIERWAIHSMAAFKVYVYNPGDKIDATMLYCFKSRSMHDWLLFLILKIGA